ncbi:thymidylate kinase-like [Penaeus monodon]|uniref:thymidylate kinase-like n=1 Tax=Penaeus monodon TaxID=6687 RepID=UPI0018A77199|nr:thymidylate kinase-like [Penaeus monodon]
MEMKNTWKHLTLCNKIFKAALAVGERYCETFFNIVEQSQRVSLFKGSTLNMSWSGGKKSDAGLPRPDQVLFLTWEPEEAKRRGQFGAERYEKEEFQKRVYENFQLLKDDVWKVIDAKKSVEDLQEVLKMRH